MQFILGKPSSGKSYTVLEKIKELSLKGEKSILIVPEQFTFESERAVLKTVGDSFVLNTEVLSFTRLCSEIGRAVGGVAGRTLNDCDKVIFIKRAINQVKDELMIWGKYADSISFCKTLLDTINELKLNNITVEDLRKIFEITEKPTLKFKLFDVALIYETYDYLMGEKFIDPSDSLALLYEKLGNYKYFENKTVFIDSFKGFTGSQFKIIERILSQADNVYITFTDDVENNKDYNIYTNIKSTINKIKQKALDYKIDVLEPIILGEGRYKNKGLADLEKLISGIEIDKIEPDSSVNICECETVIDEAEFAARTIRKLVREQGYRYRDFVIIARDASAYNEVIKKAAEKNKISLFYDNRQPLSYFPLAVAAKSAINSLKFSSEDILRFHKSGLGSLSIDEISVLENYIYIWNIDGALWKENWDMNPNGLTEDDEEKELENKKELEKINALRCRAIEPLVKFKENFKGNAYNMAKAICDLFEDLGAAKKLVEMCAFFENEEDLFALDTLKQSYDEYMKILDSLVVCFGQKEISREEFCETLDLSVSLADVGVIPQTLDQVTFGAADRIRPSRPKIAFVLGANQGVFPSNVQNNGVFGVFDRKYLIDNNIDVPDNSVLSSIDENYLVYSNLCCPSDKLYISYYNQSLSGEKAEPSAFVDLIKSKLDLEILHEPSKKLEANNLPETESAAFYEYCIRALKDGEGSLSIKEALKDAEEFSKIDYILSANSKDGNLTEETAHNLYGKNIRLSASRIDTFNRCHFSYFCRYGLKVNKLQKAEFDVLQRGTIVHYILEKLISEYRKNLDGLNADIIATKTREYIEEYLSKVSGFETTRNAKTEFIINRILRSVNDVALHIVKELCQSDFKPTDFELEIGADDSLSFPYDNGNVCITGYVDRVDKYNGYVRIVDYKTGTRTFRLPDVLFGLNLQMLVYLYALTRASGLPDNSAAGILYQPSKRNTSDNDLAMNGLLPLDLDLYKSMEKEDKGEFIPKIRLTNEGVPYKNLSSYIDPDGFATIFDYIEKLMKKMGNELSVGDISVSPINGRDSEACKYCDFAAVCGIEDKEVPTVPNINNNKVLEKMKEGEEDGICSNS